MTTAIGMSSNSRITATAIVTPLADEWYSTTVIGSPTTRYDTASDCKTKKENASFLGKLIFIARVNQ